MKKVFCLPAILLTITFLTACGYAPAHQTTPVPDSTPQTFRAADVTIETGAVTLAGTLLIPSKEAPAPAVIIIPGSGAATRNGSWNMYRNIGEYLVQREDKGIVI